MSNTLKIVIAVLVVLVVVAGGYYWYIHRQGGAAEEVQESGMEKGVENGETSPAPTTSLPSGSSTSDASLQKDAAAIDAQMNAFSSDNASINAGLNDQSVPQSSL